MSSNKNVIIHYLSLIHYRKSFFNFLFNDKVDDYYILAGHRNPISSMKNWKTKNNKFIKVFNLNIPFKGNKFTYQFGILVNSIFKRPDIIILLGVNPLIVSSFYVFTFFKIFTKTKIIWWGHGTLGNQGKIGRKIRLFFYKKADGIFLYDESAKVHLQNYIQNVPMYVIGNSINTEDYGFNIYQDLIKRKTVIIEPLTLLFTGRITKRKRIDILLNSLRILKKRNINVQLYIIGSGDELDNLKKLSKDLNVEELVHFEGAIYDENLYKYFLNSHIYVLPNAVGLSIIHSSSFGLPLITTNNMIEHGPEMQYFKEGVNGSYYEGKDSESLADEILKWQSKLAKNKKEVILDCVEIAKKASPEKMYFNFTKAIDDVSRN